MKTITRQQIKGGEPRQERGRTEIQREAIKNLLLTDCRGRGSRERKAQVNERLLTLLREYRANIHADLTREHLFYIVLRDDYKNDNQFIKADFSGRANDKLQHKIGKFIKENCKVVGTTTARFRDLFVFDRSNGTHFHRTRERELKVIDF